MTTFYYHFTALDKLRDGSPIPRIGEWLEHSGELRICVSGLHASAHPWDAFGYANGPLLHLVELGGQIIRDTDKVVAQRRKIVASFDATDVLRSHARASALGVIHLWAPPEIVKRYLQTGDESIRVAARTAAGDAWVAAGATWVAARTAAADAWTAAGAAGVAARAAAGDTWVTAWTAAGAAARAAAGAAWAAAWTAAGAAGAAAGDAWVAVWTASGAAAWNAAWAAARERFKHSVDEKFRGLA